MEEASQVQPSQDWGHRGPQQVDMASWGMLYLGWHPASPSSSTPTLPEHWGGPVNAATIPLQSTTPKPGQAPRPSEIDWFLSLFLMFLSKIFFKLGNLRIWHCLQITCSFFCACTTKWCNSPFFCLSPNSMWLSMATSNDTCSPSKVSQHLHLQGRQKRQVSLDSVRILDCKAVDDSRGVRECVYICMLHPDLNKGRGHHQLHHIWDSILHAASNLWSPNSESQFHHHSIIPTYHREWPSDLAKSSRLVTVFRYNWIENIVKTTNMFHLSRWITTLMDMMLF